MNVRHLSVVAAAACLVSGLHSPFAYAQTEVEPGVRVSSVVSVVEHASSGAVATPVHATAILSNAHTGSNVARGLVYSGQHNTVELPGLTSALTLTTAAPVFYIHIDREDPNDQRAQLTLIRLKPAKDTRVVLNFTANAFGGSRKRHVEDVAVSKTDAEGGWLKVVPDAPLPPGEYGLVFLPKDPMLFSDRVYDFTVPAK